MHTNVQRTLKKTLFLLFIRFFFARREPVRLELSYSDLDAERYPRREVRFPSCGRMLDGCLYRAPSARGVIVIVHGFRGCAESHLGEMMRFVDGGWDVFTFDATGTRGSEGRSLRGLQQIKYDLVAAVEYLAGEEETSGLPVVLYGHSMGAYAAAAVLGRVRVAAAVCVAGFNAPVDTMRFQVRRYGGIPACVDIPLLYLHSRIVFGRDANASALDAINATDTPVLIVQGTRDDVVPDRISIYSHLHEITNPNTDVLTVSDEYRSGHSTLWLTQEAARYLLARKAELTKLRTLRARRRYSQEVDRRPLADTDDGYVRTVLEFCRRSVE